MLLAQVNRTALIMALETHFKLLLILSEHSIKSEWIETEVTAAFEEECATSRQ